MPSLFRFLVILALVCGTIYGIIYALATYVKPVTRPMHTDVPLKDLSPVQKP